MELIIIFILKVVWYCLPMSLANMLPLIFRRWFNFLAIPLDSNRLYKGQPLFGPNKTWRGLIMGILGGVLMLIIQRYAYLNSEYFRHISLIDYSQISLGLGVLMGGGAIFGDLVKSFFKRRLGRPAGSSWFPFDQIDFILGGLLFSFFVFIPPIEIIIFSLILGLLIHIAVTVIGKNLGIRKGSW